MRRSNTGVAAFDAAAANATALLMAQRKRAGRTGEMHEAMIVGIVLASHAVSAVNPWDHQ